MARTNLNFSGDIITKNAPKDDTSYTNVNPGPYVGIVKQNSDPEKMGRIKVLIPALSKTNDPNETDLISCQYLSPFYGVKSMAVTDPTDPYSYAGTQHSYGMWMTPPDLDTRVLVIFAEGKIDKAFWIGCIQDAYMNHMIPGIAASEKTMPQDVKGHHSAGLSKSEVYGTDKVPAGEVNRNAWDSSGAGGFYEKISKPIHPFAETLRQQGLIQDVDRGITTSSARRESPSAVFGISTPGPVDATAPRVKLGAIDNIEDKQVNRLSGHTFTMDDGDPLGDNQLVRLRTSTGHQILMHDGEGVIYIGNASGESWIQLAANGSVDIYAGGSVAVRSKGNMDFHSDSNISMFAKGQIKMRAKDKLVLDGRKIQQIADTGIASHTNTGSITNNALVGQILSWAGRGQQHHSAGNIHLAGATVHHNSIFPNPTKVLPLMRTAFTAMNPLGTGTLATPIGDVNSAKKAEAKPLKFEQGLNETMDGMRMPTHEPYKYHYGLKHGLVSFSGAGGQPFGGGFLSSIGSLVSAVSSIASVTSAVSNLTNLTSVASKIQPVGGMLPGGVHEMAKQSTWSKLAKSVNSSAWLAQANRLSFNNIIKEGQFAADLKEKLKSVNLLKSINIESIQKVASSFAKDYDSLYKLKDGISNDAPGPWNDFGKEVKPKGLFEKFITNKNVSSLIKSTTEAVSGDATNLFKHKVFVDNAGILFADGDLSKQIASDFKTMKGDLSNFVNGTTTVGQVLGDAVIKNASTTVVGNPHLEKNVANTYKLKVNKTKNVTKHVVGNQVVSVTEVQEVTDSVGKKIASVGKSIGRIFGFS